MRPPLLKTGDTVALAAPARSVSPDETAPAIALLQSWGLRVKEPEGLYDVENQMAGSDTHRAALMQALLDDEEVRAIVCCRGGYGTVRIVDMLDFSHFEKQPKWLVGYSDITVLHSHIARHSDVATLHATMPLNITAHALTHPTPATTTLRQLLFEGRAEHLFGNSLPVENRPGSCTATLVGGNLSVLYSLLGSASDLDTRGKILLIEDLDEYLYHIDRMMTALRRAGKLDGLKGLVVGALSDMHDNTVPFGHTAEEIVRDAVAGYGYPVAFGCPVGHIGLENRAVILNAEATLEATPREARLAVGAA